MLTALRTRLDKDEDGFTLIELMVVVLIIGILIAIAIPAFLGAQTRAQDRAAQSNLRNSMTNARAVYTDNSVYPATADLITALTAAEPGLTFQTANSDNNKQIWVSVNTTTDSVTLNAKSASGKCWKVVDTKGVTLDATPDGANCTA